MNSICTPNITKESSICLSKTEYKEITFDIEDFISLVSNSILESGRQFGLTENQIRHNYYALLAVLKHDLKKTLAEHPMNYTGVDKKSKYLIFENKTLKFIVDFDRIIDITVK